MSAVLFRFRKFIAGYDPDSAPANGKLGRMVIHTADGILPALDSPRDVVVQFKDPSL